VELCRLHSCRNSVFTEAICPLLYQGYAKRWVLRAKRSGGLPEARVLGSLLMLAVRDSYGLDHNRPAPLPQLLLPVPLSRQRRLMRGHNQAQWIATEVARCSGIPLNVRDLRRQLHSIIQPGLTPLERQRNVENAFVCRRRFAGEHVAVVDDVMTSGSTVSAVAGVLLNAGCSRVDVWCATRALPS
jgi:ComF family protein